MAQAGTSAAGGVELPAKIAARSLPDPEEHGLRGHRSRTPLSRPCGRRSTCRARRRIKAYSIAVEVFGRDASFDPQTDPIVRIEAGHLRRALERYYLTAGQSDPVLITISKGGYVPSFSLRPAPAATDMPSTGSDAARCFLARRLPAHIRAECPLAAARRPPGGALGGRPFWHCGGDARHQPDCAGSSALLVETFDDLTGTEPSTAIASGLTQEVIGQLSKFKDIVVVESRPQDARKTPVPPRFVLLGASICRRTPSGCGSGSSTRPTARSCGPTATTEG